MMRVIPSLQPTQQLVALPAQLVLYVFLYLALWAIIRVKYDRPLWSSLGWVKSSVAAWQALLGGCILSIVVGLLGAAIRTPKVESPFDRFLHSPGWLLIFGVFAVVLGPVFEEVVFRGFIQPLLSRDLGQAGGVLLTGAAFGLLHGPEYSGSWHYVLLITFVGVCLGTLRSWSRSLIPAVYMHAGFNAVFFVAAIAQSHIKK